MGKGFGKGFGKADVRLMLQQVCDREICQWCRRTQYYCVRGTDVSPEAIGAGAATPEAIAPFIICVNCAAAAPDHIGAAALFDCYRRFVYEYMYDEDMILGETDQSFAWRPPIKGKGQGKGESKGRMTMS